MQASGGPGIWRVIAQGVRFYKLPVCIAGRTDVGSTAKVVYAVILDTAQGDVARIGVNCIASLPGVDGKTAPRVGWLELVA